MPHEVVGEVAAQVVQGAAEVAVDEVHRKFGWKGCLVLFLAVAGLCAGAFFLLR